MPLLAILAVVVCRAAGIAAELLVGAASQRGRTFPAYSPHTYLLFWFKGTLMGTLYDPVFR